MVNEGIIRSWKKGDPSREFKPCFNQDLGYVVGTLKGDASCYETSKFDKKVQKRYSMWMISLNAKDRDFVEAFGVALRSVLRRAKPIPVKFGKRTKQWALHAYGKHFVIWFKALTAMRLRKLLLTYKEFARGFIRGFFDSEGGPTIRRYITKYGKPQVECQIQVYNAPRTWLRQCYTALVHHFKIKPQKIFTYTQTTQWKSNCILRRLTIGNRKYIASYMKEIGFSILRKVRVWQDFCKEENYAYFPDA
jgi:intein-encoded DNA endonuclease-like protein